MSDKHRYANLVGEFLHQLHQLQPRSELRQRRYGFGPVIQFQERVVLGERHLQI